ncbi:response regulator transcription factor [Wandonia haliotis]|uniref:Response regulator transcription factor n=1 Tax=Wandonia haliotis TaxID=574963 RepID=A0ABP3XZW1_9FLAO
MKILVADDHEIIASGIRSFLTDKLGALEVKSAVNLAQLKQILAKEKFDILLQDIRFGNDDGRTFLSEIRKMHPDLLIVALSSHTDEFTVKSALAAGCSGYVSKSSPLEEILEAIQAITKGKQFVSKDIRDAMLTNLMNGESDKIKLTKRELEVLKAIQDELSTREIAEKLFLSEKTIEGYRSNLFLKFQVKNVAGLVKQAILQGYI